MVARELPTRPDCVYAAVRVLFAVTNPPLLTLDTKFAFTSLRHHFAFGSVAIVCPYEGYRER